MTGTARPGSLIPAAALVGLLFFDVLRVWLPSLLFIVADAGSTSAVVMGVIALAIALVAPVVAGVLGDRLVTIGWAGGMAALLGGRLVLQFSAGGSLQFVASSLAIVGAGTAVAALAAGSASGHEARLGVFMGVAASIAIHAALGTTDLVWRDGPVAWAVLGVMLGATAAASHSAKSVLRPRGNQAGPAWPWWALGPAFILLGVLTAAPGRVAAATRWDDPWVVATVIGAHGFAVMAALSGRRLGPVLGGTIGAALVLIGTTGSLRAASVASVIAQIMLAVGIGLVLGSMDRTEAGTTVRRRGVAAGAFPVVLVIIGFAYYAGYDLALPFPERTVLLLTALALAAAGFVATRGPRPMLRERGLIRQAGLVAAATLVTAGAGALLVLDTGSPDVPAPGTPSEPITVALFNVRMGFDPSGQMALGRVGDILDEADPDIVVLNEVDRGWLTTGSRDALRLLGERLDMRHVFGPAADEVWGNAVLSRYPISEVSVERLPQGADAMGRSQMTMVLEVKPEQRIALIATHLSHVDSQGDTRLPQARAVAGTLARLRERQIPVIVAGDLNAQPGASELATFGDLARSVVPPGTPTFPSWAPETQIDHILVTPEFDVVDWTVPDVQASDHLPVITTLMLETDPE